jgi:VanZ family protein
MKIWLPLLLWMALIFCASSDSQSGPHVSRIIGPLLRRIVHGISDHGIDLAILLVRKAAHFFAYTVLALLLWRWLRPVEAVGPRSWSWSKAAQVLLLVTLYAVSDEVHQAFVPTRQARVADVVIDTAGGAFGMLLVWARGKSFKRS